MGRYVLWTLRFVASHLGLFCLPMSHKKAARLKRVKLSSRFLTGSDANWAVLPEKMKKIVARETWSHKLCKFDVYRKKSLKPHFDNTCLWGVGL